MTEAENSTEPEDLTAEESLLFQRLTNLSSQHLSKTKSSEVMFKSHSSSSVGETAASNSTEESNFSQDQIESNLL